MSSISGTSLSSFYTETMDWTFTMDWQLFALSQMGLLAVGISTAFFLHARTLKTQNTVLRRRIAQVEATPSKQSGESDSPSMKEWVRAHLETLPQEDPAYPIIKAVLRNAIRPKEDFSARFPEIVAKAGFDPGDGLDDQATQDRIIELESQLQASENSADLNHTQAAELKTLLQQFTRDSREMMACIQHLERENLILRNGFNAQGLPLPDLPDVSDTGLTTEVESAA